MTRPTYELFQRPTAPDISAAVLSGPTLDGTDFIPAQAVYVWDTNTLSWIPWDGSVSGGGGGGAATVADGADVTQGAIADAAVTTSAAGTLSAKLRGIVALLTSVITSLASIDGKTTAVNTGAVVVSSSALPSGAATEAGNLATIAAKDFATQTTLALIKAKTDNIDVALSTRTKPADQQHVIVDSSAAVAVTGPLTDTELRASAVPISAATLPLPSGAATETTLGTRLSESAFDTKIGSLTETAPATDTASSGLNGRLQRIAQRITSLIAAIGSPFQVGGSIGNTSFGATQATAANLNNTEVNSDSIKTAVETIDNFISGSRGLVTEDSAAAIKTAVETIDNFISGARGLVTEDNSAAMKTALETIDNFISGARGLVTEDNSASIKTAVEKIPSQGQAVMAASMPVAIASNQSSIPVTEASATAILAALAALTLAQGASSSGITGPMVQGLVTDAPQSFIPDTFEPLSLTSDGSLRVSSVDADNTQAWQKTFSDPWAANNSPWEYMESWI